LLQRIDSLRRRLQLQMRTRLTHAQLNLDGMTRRMRHPGERLRQQAQRLDDLDMRLNRALLQQLQEQRQKLARTEAQLSAQHPGRQLALLKTRLLHLSERLPRALQGNLLNRQQRLASAAHALQLVSPLATLGRGYSILLDQQGQAIRSAAKTRPGQKLRARLAEGELLVRVEDNHVQPVTLSLLD
jgi:exodeoxyribonuclease VII large subunit